MSKAAKRQMKNGAKRTKGTKRTGGTRRRSATPHSSLPTHHSDLPKVDHAAFVRVGEVHHEKIEAGDPRYSKEALAELGASLKAGQLEPIGVNAGRGKDTFELIWGLRRLLAAKAAGVTHLEAQVYVNLTPGQVARLRATENVQRAQWSAMDEAEVVGDLVEAALAGAGGGGRNGLDAARAAEAEREAQQRVAEQLGKPVSWVSERAYLSRLSPRARKLVSQGRLPLGHAVEIARLASHELQDELANAAATDDKREQPMPLKWLKERVEKHLMSLADVPWVLHLPVAGQVACDACPRNTANQVGLFEEGGKGKRAKGESGGAGGGGGGTCTDPVCFAIKRKLIDRELKKAVASVVDFTMKHQGVKADERRDYAVKQALSEKAEAIAVKPLRLAVAAAVDGYKAPETEEARAKREQIRLADAKRLAEEEALEEAQHAAHNYELKRAEKLIEALRHRWDGPDGAGMKVMLRSLMGTAVVNQAMASMPDAERKKLLESPAMLACLQVLGAKGAERWAALCELERRWPKGRDVLQAEDLVRGGLVTPIAEAMEIFANVIGEPKGVEAFVKAANGAKGQSGK